MEISSLRGVLDGIWKGLEDPLDVLLGVGYWGSIVVALVGSCRLLGC